MGDGIALQFRDCLNEMLELEEDGGFNRINLTPRQRSMRSRVLPARPQRAAAKKDRRYLK